MDKINELASKHLGKASDGTTVQPYVTPDQHDEKLLTPVPRILNRTHLGIGETTLPFVGVDMWNAYEVSFLLDNGYPVSGVARICYTAYSPNIVESKSLKLYLNSFNMERLGKSLKEAITKFEVTASGHLTGVIGTKVQVSFFSPVAFGRHFIPNSSNEYDELHGMYTRIESLVKLSNVQFDAYSEDPSLLQLVDTPVTRGGKEIQAIATNALRSNCRVTNQPDWGDVFIVVDGKKNLVPSSVLQYIVSMRRENHFHEEICETIYKRLYDILPKETKLLVACLYTRRGGIDINPVRASNRKMIDIWMPYVFDVHCGPYKTIRQ